MKMEGEEMMTDRYRLNPLMRAATEKDTVILLKLLAQENLNDMLFAKDRNGRTALDWARMCRNHHAVSFF